MNTLTVILSIIIILLIIYLYLKYYKYKKSIESFDIPNSYYNTQTSLATSFQNNVDKDIKHNKNVYNNPTIKPNIKYAGWNGLWRSNDDSNLNSAFLQNNDKLLISFSNISLDEVYSNMNSINENSTNLNNCSNNLFLGIGQLNNERNSFNLTKIICNKYVNYSLNLKVNSLSGTISDDKKNIKLFSVGKTIILTLYKYNYYEIKENTNINNSNISNTPINTNLDGCRTKCNNDNKCIGFSYNNINNTCYLKNGTSNIVTDNNYVSYLKNEDLLNSLPDSGEFLNSTTPFVNNYQNIPLSGILFSKLYCTNGKKPCYNNNSGIKYTTYNGLNYNACGTTVSDTDNNCATTFCLVNNNNIANIPKCNINIKLNDYMNHRVFNEISQKSKIGNTLNICNHIETIKKCNSYIICYISNIGNVYTLNYQFFGTLPEQSNLTVQVDIMNEKLNNAKNKLVVLPFYRYLINNYNNPSKKISIKNKLNALSFTNCFENNKINGDNNLKISSSMLAAKKYVNNYTAINGNNNLKPAVWTINYNKNVNLVNSCSITLSTSEKYKSSIKYVNFDNENVNLSLYSGGSNGEFIMENTRVIHQIDFENTSFVAITTNLRANNQLYLVPNTSNGGFSNNSNIVSLTNSPEENGKWLLIGFNLDKITNLIDEINNIKFYIDNNEEI